MSAAPTTPKAPNAAAADPAVESADVNVRIAHLHDDIASIRKELRSIEGKLKNRDPGLLSGLKAENAKLKQRLDRLEKALFALLSDNFQPRDAGEAKAKVETLRLTAVEHCKRANVDTNLWKKIES